jgi:hypothetical protein
MMWRPLHRAKLPVSAAVNRSIRSATGVHCSAGGLRPIIRYRSLVNLPTCPLHDPQNLVGWMWSPTTPTAGASTAQATQAQPRRRARSARCGPLTSAPWRGPWLPPPWPSTANRQALAGSGRRDLVRSRTHTNPGHGSGRRSSLARRRSGPRAYPTSRDTAGSWRSMLGRRRAVPPVRPPRRPCPMGPWRRGRPRSAPPGPGRAAIAPWITSLS